MINLEDNMNTNYIKKLNFTVFKKKKKGTNTSVPLKGCLRQEQDEESGCVSHI